MIRRDFLRRLAITTAGILVADDALELLVEPRRKVWPGADLQTTHPPTLAEINEMVHRIFMEHIYPAVVKQIEMHRVFLSQLSQQAVEGNRLMFHV